MDPVDSHLLRPADVVELLGVSRSWLYDAAKSGRIPCVRLGGSDGPVRFRLRELDAWIEQGRVTRSSLPPPGLKPSASRARSATRAGVDTTQLRLLSSDAST